MIHFGRQVFGWADIVRPEPISFRPNVYLRPRNTVAPVITGTTTVGSLLTCTAGTWVTAFTISYRWSVGSVDTGVTTNTYTILAADVGQIITCRVTNKSATLGTAVNARVYIPFTAPVNSVAPTIIGNTPAGSILTVNSTGTWSGGTIQSFTYQWQRNSINIAGQTLPQYKTTAASVGLPVRCVVTAVNADFSVPANSNAITVT